MIGASPLLALVVAGPTPVPTEEPPPEPRPESGATSERDGAAERLEALERRVEILERENRALRAERASDDSVDLEARVEELEHTQDRHDRRIETLLPLGSRVGGYIDAGAFWVGGNGVGFQQDFGNEDFPEFRDRPGQEGVDGTWVFMGDPLSTTVNSRGDVADMGPSQAIRFDAVGAGGNPSFAVNALNLRLNANASPNVTVQGLVDFLPRTRDVSDPDGVGLGDFVDIKLAQLRWMVPVRRFDLDLYIGKIDSVLGREYRAQEAPDRITVTPSVLCRYTCERSMGVGARFRFLERRLMVNLAVTNGSNFRELFGLHDETDSNAFKTISARVAGKIPGPVRLELGASGAFGAQDLQPYNDVFQWQYGFDLGLRWKGLELAAEYVEVNANGKTTDGGVACDLAQCLSSRGVYGLVAYRFFRWLVPYFRADWRDALHRAGPRFVYVTDGLRLTPGLSFPVTEHVTVKAEYNVNLELRRIPDFPNDVLTTSVVGYF